MNIKIHYAIFLTVFSIILIGIGLLSKIHHWKHHKILIFIGLGLLALNWVFYLFSKK